MSKETQTASLLGRRNAIRACLTASIVLIAFMVLPLVRLSATELDRLAAVPTDGKIVKILISNFVFTPSELTIVPGTTVEWINQDEIPHLVFAETLALKSKALDTKDSFSFTFTKPGEIKYFCLLHPHMVGKIIVQARDAQRVEQPNGPQHEARED
jgi:plastocyanin